MQHVFTHGLRGEKTKMTEIGEIPKSWEVVELGPLAETVTKGSSPRWQGFAYRKSGVLFLRSQNVGWGRLLMHNVAYVDPSFNEKETRSIIKRGDLLINLVGASIGRAAVADERLEGANTNQAVGIARLSSGELVPEFAMYFLLTDAGQGEISYNKKEIARANISLTDIKNFRVAKPSPAEQLNIVQILHRLDDAQGLHESRKSALQDLFKTTLNKLMTGGIRVMDLDIDVSEVN
jgi:restriction endonuclease S subunit